jgi:CRP-like cAMP-binding protein
MTERRFAAGETIFREGEPADDAYLIHAGRVEIVKQAPGGPVRLARLGAGEMFGEMGGLDSTPRSATARALWC